MTDSRNSGNRHRRKVSRHILNVQSPEVVGKSFPDDTIGAVDSVLGSIRNESRNFRDLLPILTS